MNTDELKAELKKLQDEKYHLLKLVNHDIRSPFNRLFALLQLFEMESEGMNSQQNEYLDSMYLSILSGLEMIQNLRDMRELDAGNVEISHSAFQIDDLVKNATRTFSKQLEIKNVKIILDENNLDVELNSDSYYLQRVVENVLSNAIKFSKEGSEVHLQVTKDDKLVQVKIRDFGEGIKLDEQSMLFTKFKKLSSFATGGEGSLGLGLYNAMAFAKLMNADIKLDDEAQLGTTFIISIPLE